MTAPSAVVTLLTDFGLSDPFVGIMKGMILTRCPELRLVDLTHAIEPQNVAGASFWLRASYRWFPPATVHLAVVDPGVGTPRAELGVEADGHLFVGPDNGLLAPIMEGAPGARAYRLDRQALGLGKVSATFHGRDVFAPAAALLASGRATLEEIGAPVDTVVPGPLKAPQVGTARVEGEVITVDHFGNLLTNIPAHLLARFRAPRIRCAGVLFPLHRTYGDVSPGEPLALVNAFDVLELARACGSAAAGLSRGRGTAVIVDEPA